MALIEKHILSDFMVTERSDSQLIPRATVYRESFKCPVCRTPQNTPQHGKPGKCEKSSCRIHWLSYGNSINLSTRPITRHDIKFDD